jgi:HEPN domain-containing protein
MCQQAVEKLVKGLYTMYIDDNVPRAHNIKTLFERFENKLTVQVPTEVYHLLVFFPAIIWAAGIPIL